MTKENIVWIYHKKIMFPKHIISVRMSVMEGILANFVPGTKVIRMHPRQVKNRLNLKGVKYDN